MGDAKNHDRFSKPVRIGIHQPSVSSPRCRTSPLVWLLRQQKYFLATTTLGALSKYNHFLCFVPTRRDSCGSGDFKLFPLDLGKSAKKQADVSKSCPPTLIIPMSGCFLPDLESLRDNR